MYNEIESILFSEQQLRERIEEMGREIARDYAGKDLVMIAILRGATIFYADLARAINIPAALDFMVVTRYGRKDRPEEVRILKDLDTEVKNRDLLLVEDVIDNGDTIHFLVQALQLRKPRSLKLCTLFDKPKRRTAKVAADYIGFELPDRFVVGFGLDYQQRYRNLPYLATLNPGSCVYEKAE